MRCVRAEQHPKIPESGERKALNSRFSKIPWRGGFSRLGNPNGARALSGLGNAAGVAGIKAKADRHAQAVLPVIEDIRGAGVSTLAGVADELNERGILTARRGKWYPGTVRITAIAI